MAIALPIALWCLAPGPLRARWPAGLSLWALAPALYALSYHWFGDQNAFDTADVRRVLAAAFPAVPAPQGWRLVLTTVELGTMLSVYGIDQVLGGASDGSRIDGSQWAAAAAFAAVAVGVFVRGGSPWRQRTLALAVLIAASYGAVAIGRSPLIPPLSLLYVATAPRYHYPATALLAALVGLLVYRVGAGIRLPPGITRLALALWLAAIATRVAWRSPAEDLTAAGRPALDYALGAMRDRIAAAPDGATVYIENRPFAGVAAFTRPAVFPGWAALYAIFHADWETASRRVLFIDADPAVRANADRSPRAAGLIVAPDDVPIELRPAPVAGSPPPG